MNENLLFQALQAIGARECRISWEQGFNEWHICIGPKRIGRGLTLAGAVLDAYASLQLEITY